MEVEGEGAAAEGQVLDEVLADPGEAQERGAVSVEGVAREHEVHDVQEELGEGGQRGLLGVHGVE